MAKNETRGVSEKKARRYLTILKQNHTMPTEEERERRKEKINLHT